MEAATKNDRTKITDSESLCVLVEFPNEQNKVAVAYLKWIKDVTFRYFEEIDDVISSKTHLKMKWPTDSLVLSSLKQMEKKSNISWITAIARILAYGGL